MASVTREVVAAIQSRAAVYAHGALVPPCLTSSIGALPRLLSIR